MRKLLPFFLLLFILPCIVGVNHLSCSNKNRSIPEVTGIYTPTDENHESFDMDEYSIFDLLKPIFLTIGGLSIVSVFISVFIFGFFIQKGLDNKYGYDLKAIQQHSQCPNEDGPNAAPHLQ